MLVFVPLREHFGVPIGVTSFFTDSITNAVIGRSDNSQHSKGEAIDIDADVYGKVTNREIFYYILDNLPFDQLIWEFGDECNPRWVHVSLKAFGNRKQVLRAYKENGETKYKIWNPEENYCDEI